MGVQDGGAQASEASDNIGQNISVPEAAALCVLFVFLIKLGICVVFFFSWCLAVFCWGFCSSPLMFG